MGRASRLARYAEAGALGAVAAATVLVILGVAGGVMVAGCSGQCFADVPGVAGTTAVPDPLPVPSPAPSAGTSEFQIADAAQAAEASFVPASLEKATPSTGDLVADSFALIDIPEAEPAAAAATAALDAGNAGVPEEHLRTSLPAIAPAPLTADQSPAAVAAGSAAATAGPSDQPPGLAYAQSAVATAAATGGPEAIPQGVEVAETAPAASTVAPPAAADTTAARTGLWIVAGRGVNVRSGPGKSAGRLFALRGGAEVTLTGKDDHGWLEVKTAEGRTGWVYRDYLLSK